MHGSSPQEIKNQNKQKNQSRRTEKHNPSASDTAPWIREALGHKERTLIHFEQGKTRCARWVIEHRNAGQVSYISESKREGQMNQIREVKHTRRK